MKKWSSSHVSLQVASPEISNHLHDGCAANLPNVHTLVRLNRLVNEKKKKEFSTILRKTETTQCLNTAYSSSHRVGERFIQKSQQRYKPQSHISTNTGSGTCRQWRMFTLDTRGEISLLIAANTRENNLFFPHWPMPSSDPTTALSLPIAQPITYLAMCYGNLIITNTAKQNYCLISILKEYQW